MAEYYLTTRKSLGTRRWPLEGAIFLGLVVIRLAEEEEIEGEGTGGNEMQ